MRGKAGGMGARFLSLTQRHFGMDSETHIEPTQTCQIRWDGVSHPQDRDEITTSTNFCPLDLDSLPEVQDRDSRTPR